MPVLIVNVIKDLRPREIYRNISELILVSIGYHMSGEVISVLSLEGRYYNYLFKDIYTR